MRHPKEIIHRARDPFETRWVVVVGEPEPGDSLEFITYGPHGRRRESFPTIAEACDYARSQQQVTS